MNSTRADRSAQYQPTNTLGSQTIAWHTQIDITTTRLLFVAYLRRGRYNVRWFTCAVTQRAKKPKAQDALRIRAELLHARRFAPYVWLGSEPERALSHLNRH